MADYAEALKTFNETVANLNQIADVQRMSTISELNAIQAQSMDPSDMEAYNMTMYGVNQIHGVKTHIVSTVGDVNNYNLPVDPTPVATSVPYVTEHTSISSSIVSLTGGGSEHIFSHFLADPASILPTENPALWLIYGAFGLILGKFLILRR
ncbi:hypothetical protein [Methanocella sp. MCL-LM]|uniref:hypothetical protein n=1 Tax=Methanocella sp. MCL-LM TaxID=3412035 RepID=UPI003C73CA9C